MYYNPTIYPSTVNNMSEETEVANTEKYEIIQKIGWTPFEKEPKKPFPLARL